jgi:hypothetical protein
LPSMFSYLFYYIDLNALGGIVYHIGRWTLKMHFCPPLNLLSGTYRPLNFENAFMPPLNLLSGTPYAHTCHADIFLLTWHCYVVKKYAPNPAKTQSASTSLARETPPHRGARRQEG